MRKVLLSAAVLAMLLSSAALALAGDGCSVAAPACGTDGDPCGSGCCRAGCGLLGRGCRGDADIDGLDRHFNCGCKGSYNYPVPPQYTYHWPGMYKQNLMTDYTSPWRFPPLKAYVDELPVLSTEATALPMLQTISVIEIASAHTPRSGEIESMSSRLSRVGR